MLLVWRMRQDIDFQRTRVLVNATLAAAAQGDNIQAANKELQNAWQDYLDEAFPYQKGKRMRTDEAAIEFLKREVAKGPLSVTPLQPVGKAASKLKTRWFKREEEK